MRREVVYIAGFVAGRIPADLEKDTQRGYFSLDDALVWQIAVIHTPILREQVVAILHKEFPGPA
jgi:uncharacterized protein with HEPN domain